MQIDSERKSSWTDALPLCTNTGCGDVTNQTYREDGAKVEGYKCQDRRIYCKIDENTFLYALFSGHVSPRVAEYTLQKMSAEILLGQLNSDISEDDIIRVVEQAFNLAESDYSSSVDYLLAKRATLQMEIPEGLSQYEISQKYQAILDEISQVNRQLSAGASVVLALIYKSKLYIGNCGTSRALLCKNDEHNVLRVTQLSVDHDLWNEDEILRLKDLGLDPQALQAPSCYATRCIGNYMGKAGYKECSFLSTAHEAPIIATPEIVGPITIDDSCRFLILMSSGLCRSLADIFALDSSQLNKEMVQMVVEQFRSQSTINGVAQSVVNKIALLHHDTFMDQLESGRPRFNSREDITLLIRNFNFPIANANVKRGSGQSRSSDTESSNSIYFNSVASSTTTTTSETETGRFLDPNAKIKPYVDFSGYFERVEAARKNGTLPAGINFN